MIRLALRHFLAFLHPRHSANHLTSGDRLSLISSLPRSILHLSIPNQYPPSFPLPSGLPSPAPTSPSTRFQSILVCFFLDKGTNGILVVRCIPCDASSEILPEIPGQLPALRAFLVDVGREDHLGFCLNLYALAAALHITKMKRRMSFPIVPFRLLFLPVSVPALLSAFLPFFRSHNVGHIHLANLPVKPLVFRSRSREGR